MRRVNEAVREVISAHITAGDLRDPRIGFVTVTDVDTSRDLAHARVYVSVLGGPERRDEALAGLDAARGYLQGHIGAELRMKRTPQLAFHYDESVDRGFRIGELLQRVAKDRADADEGEGSR